MSTTTNQPVYDRITGSIIASLERGVAPWVRPWAVTLPYNAVSRRQYRGVNILGCLAHQLEYGHTSSAYLTFQQATSLGGWVRQGERGVLVVLYREVPVPVKDQDDDVDDGRRMFLTKGFTVFNLEQTGGLEEFRERLEAQAQGFQTLGECEQIVRSTGAAIRETGTEARYSPALDLITMPPRQCFRRPEDYYAVLWHETVHWTGARHRLNRDLSGTFGSPRYAQEELVAELGACFLSGRVGIEHISRSASYIGNWLTALREDKRYIFVAAKLATQAAQFIYPDSNSLPHESY